ncbi:MAG: F0F1 ATP synthase subunit A [Candidatus Sumerlaeaceae bacterium]|jgi:F-type H+-transporting ATPase subunit a
MMPSAIRKLMRASGVMGAAVAAMWAIWDWKAGATFALAVAWAVANVFVWTRLIQAVLVLQRRSRTAVFSWLGAKLAMLGGGFAAVWAAAPLSVGQTLALTIGVFSVLLAATVLAFLGAFLDTPKVSTEENGNKKSSAARSVISNLAAVAAVLALLVSAEARANAPAVSPAPSESKANVGLREKSPGEDAGAQKSSAAAFASEVSNEGPKHEASAAHGEVAEGHGHEEAAKPELPNFITVLLQLELGGRRIADTSLGHFLHTYEYQIFLVLITMFLCGVILATAGLRALVPGPTQALLEMVVEGAYNFFASVLGSRERARRHMPFFGSLFLFIWFNNMFGIVPLFTGATSTFQLTASLAVLVFFYVHVNAIHEAGFKHWLLHLMQDPKDFMGWVLAPVFFVLHVIGELAKPLSLSLRLFGNITGEHILSGVFLILGLLLMSAVWPHPLVGVPLHLPFLFLSLLVGTIQAVVFTLLSTIYLALFLPHDEHEHGHGGEQGEETSELAAHGNRVSAQASAQH